MASDDLLGVAVGFLALILALAGIVLPVSEGGDHTHNLSDIDDFTVEHLLSPHPYNRRQLFDPEGTSAQFVGGGTGGVLFDYVWYLALKTGTGVGVNFYRKNLNIPEPSWINCIGEAETAIFNRDARANMEGSFILGDGIAVTQVHCRADVVANAEYCAFFWVSDAVAGIRRPVTLYARTYDNTVFQETNIGVYPYPAQIVLRIEKTASFIYYYVDNILVTTHNAYAWGQSGSPYIENQIYNNATNDASTAFYYSRYLSDY